MKKKFLAIFILIAMLSLVLVGCNSGNKDVPSQGDYSSVEGDYTAPQGAEVGDIIPINRKIIFKVEASIQTDDLNATVKRIRNNIQADEWADRDSVSRGYAQFVIRIKSDRLDEFLEAIFEGKDELISFDKTATDVSLKYQSIEGRVAALAIERDRLIELMDSVSVYEFININSRLTQIELELSNLQGELNKFDDLYEYSEVYLTVQGGTPREKSPSPSFGTRLKNTFIGAWNGLKTVLGALLLVIVAITPFLIIIVPVAAIIVVVYLRKKKAKKNLAPALTKDKAQTKDKKEEEEKASLEEDTQDKL